MPEMRQRELKRFTKIPEDARKAGVMALCYPGIREQATLVLIQRPSYPGVHSGQVALPGGRFEDDDKDLLVTALRETEEEVGVPIEVMQPIRSLSSLYIPPSNFVVSPYMGIANTRPEFILQEEEVAGIIEITLAQLLNDSSTAMERLTTSYAQQIEVPAFRFDGHLVWGATAMILNEFKSLLRTATSD